MRELLAYVDTHPLTIVLGASGTGKSSVVKAGVLPRVREDGRHHVLPVKRRTGLPLVTTFYGSDASQRVRQHVDARPDVVATHVAILALNVGKPPKTVGNRQGNVPRNALQVIRDSLGVRLAEAESTPPAE